nr:hypothetical protein CFP56_01760 [Quercus suber]
MLNFNFLQFREILAILPNTVAEVATECWKFKWPRCNLTLPVTEIPKWLKINHHQSVGNSVSFLVGPKLSNLVVCIAFPSKDVPNYLGDRRWRMWFVHISINGKTQSLESSRGWAKSNYDHLWLMYWKVNISNPSEENRIEVEVINEKGISNISLNRMKIYVECICCPQKPNISPASSMDQCAFNNGEEDSGHVGIRRRLRRRNHRPTHARRPQKHYLGWLRVRYQLWKQSSKPWRRIITNGFHDEGSSSILNTFLNDDTNANLYRREDKNMLIQL